MPYGYRRRNNTGLVWTAFKQFILYVLDCRPDEVLAGYITGPRGVKVSHYVRRKFYGRADVELPVL